MKHGPQPYRSLFSRGGAGGRSPGDRSDIDRVKDATDLVRLIGEHIALKAKGREYVGLCPFHDDRSPSMCVVPEKQFYKCFSCGASGDCYGFVQNYLKMDFREALQFLADRCGVTLTPLRRDGGKPGGHGAAGADGTPGSEGPGNLNKRALFGASALANDFFQAVLKHPEHGKTAREIVAQRQIAPEMVALFQLGASPDRWDGLLLTAQQRGVPVGALQGAGLIKQRDTGSGFYDSFRNRLMFPIHDRSMRVIAFGARKINPEDEPKYLNSPETRLFHKSATLYALPMALRAMQQTRTAVICEGYMDVIACHQGGFGNAVATLGTALTRDHAKQLRLACDTIVLLFDGDEAGQRATDRAAEVFFAEPLDVKVVTLSKHTDAKDPDELLKREGGSAVFRAALAGATDLLAYRFARIRERVAGAGVAALTRAMHEELETLVGLGLGSVEPMRQALIVRQLASIASVSEQTIRAAIPAGRNGPRGQVSTPAAGDDDLSDQQRSDRTDARGLRRAKLTHAECILGCLLCDGHLWQSLSEADKDLIAPRGYRFAVVSRVAQTVHDLGEDGLVPSLDAVLSGLGDDEPAREAAIALMSRMDEQAERSPTRLHAFWHWSFAQARRDAVAGKPPEPGQAGAPVAIIESKEGGTISSDTASDVRSLEERAKALANLHRTLGPDRRKVPRAGG